MGIEFRSQESIVKLIASRKWWVFAGLCISTAAILSPPQLWADEVRQPAKAALSIKERENFLRAADYSARTRGLSVMVMRGGHILFEGYHNGHTAQTPHLLASGTKSFSGVMAAAAVEDGLIQFDEKVSDTITQWKTDPLKSKMTIRQLLSLSGGIASGVLGWPPSYAEALQLEAEFEPGTTFEYGPSAFQVFGELMRRKLVAKNETPLDYLKRRVFNPIGLKVASWTHQEGQPNLPSGAALTTSEWAKFGQFILQGGKWNGQQLIAKKFLDQCFVGSKANPNYGLTF